MLYEDHRASTRQKVGVWNLIFSPLITLALFALCILFPIAIILLPMYWKFTHLMIED